MKQPKFISPVTNKEENPSKKASAPKTHVEPDPKPTSMIQPNGKNGVGLNQKKVEEKDGNLTGQVKEKKEVKSVFENASKKKTTNSGVTKWKPSRNDLNKFLVLIVGFAVGVYCSDFFVSLIG